MANHTCVVLLDTKDGRGGGASINTGNGNGSEAEGEEVDAGDGINTNEFGASTGIVNTLPSFSSSSSS
jgi:hypothetical protein